MFEGFFGKFRSVWRRDFFRGAGGGFSEGGKDGGGVVVPGENSGGEGLRRWREGENGIHYQLTQLRRQ